jgi:hypothetical protein
VAQSTTVNTHPEYHHLPRFVFCLDHVDGMCHCRDKRKESLLGEVCSGANAAYHDLGGFARIDIKTISDASRLRNFVMYLI